MILGECPLDACLVSHDKSKKMTWGILENEMLARTCERFVSKMPCGFFHSISMHPHRCFFSSFLHCGIDGKIIERLVV